MTKKGARDKPNDAKPPPAVPKKEPALYLKLMPTIVIFGAMLATTVPIYQKFGINIFLSPGSKQLAKSGEEWRTMLPNKTIAMVGGPHRGGTTVLWDELRRHPDVADFGTTAETGVDWSEGTFLQVRMSNLISFENQSLIASFQKIREAICNVVAVLDFSFRQSIYPSFGVGQEFRKMGKVKFIGDSVLKMNVYT